MLLCDGRGQEGRQRQLTRFKDRAYSGCYRSDGQLLVAGGESGLVQVSCLHSATCPDTWARKSRLTRDYCRQLVGKLGLDSAIDPT